MFEQLGEPKEQQPPDLWDRLTRKAALVVGLCSTPFYFAFAILGNPGRGRAAAMCAFVFFTTIWLRWDLRGKAWFWITLALLVAVHLPLLFLVRWSNTNYPGVTLLPIGLADLAIVYGPIRLLEIVVSRRSKAD